MWKPKIKSCLIAHKTHRKKARRDHWRSTKEECWAKYKKKKV